MFAWLVGFRLVHAVAATVAWSTLRAKRAAVNEADGDEALLAGELYDLVGGPNPNNIRPVRSDDRTVVIETDANDKRAGLDVAAGP